MMFAQRAKPQSPAGLAEVEGEAQHQPPASLSTAVIYYPFGDTARGREKALRVLQEGPRTLRGLICQRLPKLAPIS